MSLFNLADITNIHKQGASGYLGAIEDANLSNAFWETGLPQQMVTSSASSPYFNDFLASQVRLNEKGFLSRDLTVRDLLKGKRDVHHVFPRNYLKSGGLGPSRYNQIANYAVMQVKSTLLLATHHLENISQNCGNSVRLGIRSMAALRMQANCMRTL